MESNLNIIEYILPILWSITVISIPFFLFIKKKTRAFSYILFFTLISLFLVNFFVKMQYYPTMGFKAYPSFYWILHIFIAVLVLVASLGFLVKKKYITGLFSLLLCAFLFFFIYSSINMEEGLIFWMRMPFEAKECFWNMQACEDEFKQMIESCDERLKGLEGDFSCSSNQ